jgi:hypothetical protein
MSMVGVSSELTFADLPIAVEKDSKLKQFHIEVVFYVKTFNHGNPGHNVSPHILNDLCEPQLPNKISNRRKWELQLTIQIEGNACGRKTCDHEGHNGSPIPTSKHHFLDAWKRKLSNTKEWDIVSFVELNIFFTHEKNRGEESRVESRVHPAEDRLL